MSVLLVALVLTGVLSFVGFSAKAQNNSGSSGAPASSGGAGGSSAGSTDLSIPQSGSAEALLADLQSPLVERAISEGLQELAARQNVEEGTPEFGSFGNQEVRVAKSALAGLALVASGSLPNSGPYGLHVSRCVDYILRQQDPNTGFFADSSDHSRIHGHGYAMFFLSQVYGHSPRDAEISKSLSAGIRCLKAGQTRLGGWGYVPNPEDPDEASTTVCALQALRCCQMAGFEVPLETIANAIGYLDLSKEEQYFMNNEGKPVRGYTFKYSVASGRSSHSWTLVAACCACLNNIGAYSKYARWNGKDIGAVLEGGIGWLHHHFDKYMEGFGSGSNLENNFFYYAQFYACQALWQYSDISLFKAYYPRVRDALLNGRAKSGTRYWTHSQYGDAYATAFALLVLQLPYQYLPAFQR